jgi:hypothetical protein
MLVTTSMSNEEIVNFLEGEIEPLKDPIYGDLYRASAYMNDGTYLPCAVFQSKKRLVDLAARVNRRV